jgi:hypothetical protein
MWVDQHNQHAPRRHRIARLHRNPRDGAGDRCGDEPLAARLQHAGRLHPHAEHPLMNRRNHQRIARNRGAGGQNFDECGDGDDAQCSQSGPDQPLPALVAALHLGWNLKIRHRRSAHRVHGRSASSVPAMIGGFPTRADPIPGSGRSPVPDMGWAQPSRAAAQAFRIASSSMP